MGGPSRVASFTVGADQGGRRVDHVLAGRAGIVSRTAAQRLIAGGHVTINEKVCSKHDVVHAGDLVTYEVPPPRETGVCPEPIDLDIRYEDADLIVVSKPAGLVVHPSHGHDSGTLVNALLHHCPDLSGIGGEKRPGIVHRLDRDTSGLMLVAKNDTAHVELARQLKRHEIERTYVALARGNVPMDEGIVDAPVGRSPRDRKKMAVTVNGRVARTRFRVIERLKGYTLLELSLETGRTHQIRVHLAHIGHPVAGDLQYGPSRQTKDLGLERQFLHAIRLDFKHPRTHEAMSISDELPESLSTALEAARAA